jgi:hypothetical protein
VAAKSAFSFLFGCFSVLVVLEENPYAYDFACGFGFAATWGSS